jgi:hypothetical protein
MKRIINVETGEVIDRPFNAEEIAQQKIDEANIAEANAIREAEAEEKEASRQALLTRLGITEDEARILLGGN